MFILMSNYPKFKSLAFSIMRFLLKGMQSEGDTIKQARISSPGRSYEALVGSVLFGKRQLIGPGGQFSGQFFI